MKKNLIPTLLLAFLCSCSGNTEQAETFPADSSSEKGNESETTFSSDTSLNLTETTGNENVDFINPIDFIGQPFSDVSNHYGDVDYYEGFWLDGEQGGYFIKYPQDNYYFSFGHLPNFELTDEFILNFRLQGDEVIKNVLSFEEYYNLIYNPNDYEESDTSTSFQTSYTRNLTSTDLLRYSNTYLGTNVHFAPLEVVGVIANGIFLVKTPSLIYDYSIPRSTLILDDRYSVSTTSCVVGDRIAVYGVYSTNDIITYSDGSTDQLPVITSDKVMFSTDPVDLEYIAELIPASLNKDVMSLADGSRYLNGTSIQVIGAINTSFTGTKFLKVKNEYIKTISGSIFVSDIECYLIYLVFQNALNEETFQYLIDSSDITNQSLFNSYTDDGDVLVRVNITLTWY